MKVLFVKHKGYYVAGTDTLWSSWTYKIKDATHYEEPEATNTAISRSQITGDMYEVKESPFVSDEVKSKYIDLLISGMFK